MGWGADNPPGGPVAAPSTRLVEQFTGDVADSPILGILATADHIHDSLVELERLRHDNEMLRSQADGLAVANESLRDELAEQHVRAQELWAQVLEKSDELQQVRARLNCVEAEAAGYRTGVAR